MPHPSGNRFVTGLVLAAGGSTRLGQPKQLLPYGDGTLLEHVLAIACASPLDQLIVAVGGSSDEVLARVDMRGAQIVVNDSYGQGCSSSIAASLPLIDDAADTLVLMLGGVAFPDHPALEGHSDADALLHAATDALLGAAAMGDIGVHFPPSDERWQGQASLHFLRHAASLLAGEGWSVVHLDMTVIAESPKVMKRAEEIRSVVAEALGVTVDRVSLKATTNERMGFVGRGEGIAALAVATIRR